MAIAETVANSYISLLPQVESSVECEELTTEHAFLIRPAISCRDLGGFPQGPKVVAVGQPNAQAAGLRADSVLIVLDGVDSLLEVGGVADDLLEVGQPVLFAYWVRHGYRAVGGLEQRVHHTEVGIAFE